MPSLNQAALALAFLLTSTSGTASDAISQEWARLIKADFPPGCVIRLAPYLSSTGVNGVRGGAWLVPTCEGSFEYGASYFPPGVYPEKNRIGVSRTQKLRPLTPAQLKKMYSLDG